MRASIAAWQIPWIEMPGVWRAPTFEPRPEQYAQATQSWRWLDLAGKAPLFTSPFGDVFFRAADGFWWLDTLAGALTRPWGTADELRDELSTPEGQDQYLLGGLAAAAERRGLVPADNQIYDLRFRRPSVVRWMSTTSASSISW